MFVNAMTTVSGVVFIYGPKTELASISVLNMDDTGEVASAAAMAMMIFYTNVGARTLHVALARWLERRTQAWRRGAVGRAKRGSSSSAAASREGASPVTPRGRAGTECASAA